MSLLVRVTKGIFSFSKVYTPFSKMASGEKLSKQRCKTNSKICLSCTDKVSIPAVCPVGIRASWEPVILEPSTEAGVWLGKEKSLIFKHLSTNGNKDFFNLYKGLQFLDKILIYFHIISVLMLILVMHHIYRFYWLQ